MIASFAKGKPKQRTEDQEVSGESTDASERTLSLIQRKINEPTAFLRERSTLQHKVLASHQLIAGHLPPRHHPSREVVNGNKIQQEGSHYLRGAQYPLLDRSHIT
jgi:hypothetical protein